MHRYKLGVQSLGRRQLNGPENVRPAELRATITDITPVGGPPAMAPLRTWWNRGIVQQHEEAHVTNFYTNFWDPNMRILEAEVNAQEVVFDPVDRTTQSAQAVLARQRAGWTTRADALHNAADAAEIGTAELFAFGVENPLWLAMIARLQAGVRPPPVGALTAGPVTSGSVTLNWTYATLNETGFDIQRSAGRAFSSVGVAASGTTSFTDATATPGTRFVYRVVATGTAGNSTPRQVRVTTAALPSVTPAGTMMDRSRRR